MWHPERWGPEQCPPTRTQPAGTSGSPAAFWELPLLFKRPAVIAQVEMCSWELGGGGGSEDSWLLPTICSSSFLSSPGQTPQLPKATQEGPPCTEYLEGFFFMGTEVSNSEA